MTVMLRWTTFALALAFAAAFPTENKTRVVSEKCKSSGVFCLDCKTLALCIDTGGIFLEFEVEECSKDGFPCSQSLKQCSDKQSYCGLKRNFLCQDEGLFPDPYDCNVYYECGPPVTPGDIDYAPRNTHVCPVSTAYNPKSRTCDLPDTHPSCAYDAHPVPKCDGSAPIMGALSLDPKYYWLCLNGIIRLFKCEDGHVFDVPTLRCVSDEEELPEPSTTASTGYQCSGTGKEPDPTDCYRYYDCSDMQRPLLMACPIPKYYNQRKNRCVLGFCTN